LGNEKTFTTTSTDWKHAIRLIVKEKVEIVKKTKKIIKNFEKTVVMAVPKVIRLIKFVRLKYKKEVPLSKSNIFARDEYTCCYCGKKLNSKKSGNLDSKPTIDHLVPRAKGGETSWENCVTSCRGCNSKKGSRTPNEAKMYLKRRPTKPTISEFIQLKGKSVGLDKILKDIV